MFIVNANGNRIISILNCCQIFIVETGDNFLISAETNVGEMVTVGRYARKDEAEAAFRDVMKWISQYDYVMQMPENTGAELPKIKDSRVKRKGGS